MKKMIPVALVKKILNRFIFKKRLKKTGQLLKLMIEEGEVAQYNLFTKLNCTYKTAFKLLHTLEYLGLAEISRTEPSLKRGKDKNFWRLTEEGKEYAPLLAGVMGS